MKTVWEKYTSTKRDELMSFNEDYKNYISVAKTERECVFEAIKQAESAGFKNITDFSGELKPNDRVYMVNKEKCLCLFVIGQEPLTSGMNILGAHIDSPRIDIKQNPLYEVEGIALLDTHYYGGIKKYQWVAQPMALHGVVVLKSGEIKRVAIGDDPQDPVVGISDLLIHLAADQMKKVGAKVVEGEDLDVTVGSIPQDNEEKEPVKKYILNLLKEKYGMEEKDFQSAELEIVPAGPARDYGLDRSMIMGYGHDDRVCAYTSLRAIMEMKDVKRTSCCILVDKEEVGSQGATGMQSRFFENCIVRLLDKTCGYTAINHIDTLENSFMLSSDVSAGYDSNYAAVFETKNTAFLGRGLCFNKYTGARGKGGCNDANPEFIAKIRKVLDKDEIMYQTAELGRVDQGGGGTIAYILANLNMEVIDAGIAVQNMHAPHEVVSKADVYEAYMGYKSFLTNID